LRSRGDLSLADPATSLQKVANSVVGAPSRATLPSCDESPPRPGDHLPQSNEWFGETILKQIRGEGAGANQTLLSQARGSKGPAVALVQQALLFFGCEEPRKNLLPNFGADGVFGGETRRAVEEFQKARNLTVDGVVGPVTLVALDKLFAALPMKIAGESVPPAPGTPVAPTGRVGTQRIVPPKLVDGKVDINDAGFLPVGGISNVRRLEQDDHSVRASIDVDATVSVVEPAEGLFRYGLVQNLMFMNLRARYEKGVSMTMDSVGPLVDVGEAEPTPFIHRNDVEPTAGIGPLPSTATPRFTDKPFVPIGAGTKVEITDRSCEVPVRLLEVRIAIAFRVGVVAEEVRLKKRFVLGVANLFYGPKMEFKFDHDKVERAFKANSSGTQTEALVPMPASQPLILNAPRAVKETNKALDAAQRAIAGTCSSATRRGSR
jgi:peptidoglycan hydrolase-like protein with peptidoglycan-binding domain